jgi:predicted GH43/DUF377 family glycosyl hydrolase
LHFKWKNLGLIFDLDSLDEIPDWHVSHAQAPNVVDMGEFVRVYFCGRPAPDDSGNFVSRGIYADVIPGSTFKVLKIGQSPILELGGLGEFDEFGTYPISVIKQSGRFLAYYGGWSRPKAVPFDVAIGLATSEDGESFTKHGNGPILSASPDEPFVITSPKIRFFDGRFVLTYTAGVRWFEHEGRKEIIYRNRIAFSDDGVSWTRLGREIIQTKLGKDEAQACPDIYFCNGEYHMFFCYRSSINFRDDSKFSYKLGYAKSVDLMTWERDDDNSFFVESQESWDSEMQAYPNVFDFNGKTFMVYLGNGTGLLGFGAAIRVDSHE